MAKQRYINTKFWSDTWISNLDPVEKLLYLYLITNEKTSICGIYELPLKIMAVETGIEKEMIDKILRRFEKDKKVIYKKGWINLTNFIKHQQTSSEKIKTGIEICLNQVPKDILDTLSIPYTYPSNYSNTNSNTNSNIEREAPPASNLSYLKEIPLEDIEYFTKRFDLGEKQLKSKAESLYLYCEAKGKRYKNYRAFLLNALKKDFPERQPEKIAPKDDITPEQREKNLARIKKMKSETIDKL